jgi:hypothetical protein
MLDNKFTDEDKTKVVDFLNFIAIKAEFNNWKTEDSVKHFKLLAHMQQVILPKIEANIFEVKEVSKLKKTKGE